MTNRTRAFEAALNGVLGDYLAERKSDLAIEMGFYQRGQRLTLDAEGLGRAVPRGSVNVCILVHGSSYDESCWSFPEAPETTYGTLLQKDLGFTPLYVRYNSGLHVSQNGRALANLFEALVDVYTPSISELTLIGHSMGGLLIRSACYYGGEVGHRWLTRTKRAIYLASPHLGSPHEKAGHLVSLALDAIPDPVVKLVGTVANLRSAGVKDLRHGSLVDEDWLGQDPDALGDRPRSIPLQSGIEHYLVAGTLAKDEGHVISQLLGDALVRVPSALDPGQKAGLEPDHFAVFTGMNHVRLVHDPEVYARVRRWCAGAPPEQTDGSPKPAPDVIVEESPSRANAYRALVEDAVEKGSAAVQQVQETLTARPYDVLAQVPSLEAPVKLVKAVHFGVLRGTYTTVRVLNRWTSVALERAIEAMKKKPE